MKDENIVEIEVWVATDRVGSKSTRTMKEDRESWEQMSDDEKGVAVWDFVQERCMYEYGWREKP